MTDPQAHIHTPHPDRLDPRRADHAAILAAHAAAIASGRNGYTDPSTGFWVFTAQYLCDRGFCCENGCRHCPWIARD